MTAPQASAFHVAIACGGTGGHLFPGLAVAGCLAKRGVAVTLMISPKEVDQVAVKTAGPMNVVTLPVVGLTRGRVWAFARGFRQSYAVARACFAKAKPQAALAMGGFTSAPPLLAARRFNAGVFLHESNTIPGRANRWLSWLAGQAFVGFPSAISRLHCRRVSVTGTPVRPKFQPLNAEACRSALGLDPKRPVALVMGGSQGASGINQLVMRSLALWENDARRWQWFHLTGSADVERVKEAYLAQGVSATVHPFFTEMELVLGAATAAISRAGASSLAELAAMRLPALLVPFPAATDNHQFHNAQAFVETGAAGWLDQKTAQPEELVRLFRELMCDEVARRRIQTSLATWHKPNAADEIAQAILQAVGARADSVHCALDATPARSSGRTPDAHLLLAGCRNFATEAPGVKETNLERSAA